MGTYEQGILGAFSGMVGPVVGANFRGKNVMRGKPKKSNKAPTDGQVAQRAKFSAVTHFLTPANMILSEYFGTPSGSQSRYNLATSYHLQEAVQYDGTEASILFDKALFSKGQLLGLQNISGFAGTGAKLILNWESNVYGNAKATDQLIVVIYEPISGFYEFFLNAGTRATTNATITLPAYLVGNEIQCWAFMAAVEGKLKSTSQYLGSLVVV